MRKNLIVMLLTVLSAVCGCNDPDSLPGTVKIHVNTYMSGQTLNYTLSDDNGVVLEEGFTVFNKEGYNFNLKTGNYVFTFRGSGYSDSIEFQAVAGQYTEVVLDLNERVY